MRKPLTAHSKPWYTPTMPTIDHILPYCDGTNSIDDLSEILGVTRVHISNILKRLNQQGLVVLDYTVRPMRPYRPELRPAIYFPHDNNFKHIPLPVSVGGYNWVVGQALAKENVTSSRLQTAITYLRQGNVEQANSEIQPIVDELTQEQLQAVAFVVMVRLFGLSLSTQI